MTACPLHLSPATRQNGESTRLASAIAISVLSRGAVIAARNDAASVINASDVNLNASQRTAALGSGWTCAAGGGAGDGAGPPWLTKSDTCRAVAGLGVGS